MMTIAAAAMLAPGAVRADTLPKEILGKWCLNTEYGLDSTTYARCKGNDGGTMIVKKDSAEFYEEDGCNFTSVATRIQMWGERTNGDLRWERHKVYEVKAKCSGEGSTWNATLYFNYYPIPKEQIGRAHV